MSAVDLTRGPGLRLAGLNEGFSADRWTWDPHVEELDEQEDKWEQSREGALQNGEYFEFGFTVEEGYVAYLATLDTAFRRSAFNSPMNMEWQYSLDGFETEGVTVPPVGEIWDELGWTDSTFTYLGRNSSSGVAVDYNYMLEDVGGQGAYGAPGNPMPTIDLNAIDELQEISGGTTVTFRLYAWPDSDSTTSGTNTLAFGRQDGPVLAGAVAPADEVPLVVISEFEGTDPEPGSYSYPSGTEVTLTAPGEVSLGDSVYALAGFTGTGSAPAEGDTSSVTFTLNEETTLEWEWEQISGPVEPVIAFDLTGASGESWEPTTVAPGVTAFDLALGPGINPAGLGNGLSSNGWDRADPGRETALSNGDFFEFGFAVEDGYRASLSTLEVSMRRSAVNAPMYYEWQYSFDDFATPGETIRPAGPVWDRFGWTEDYFRFHGRSGSNESYFFDEPYLYMTTRVDDLNEGAPLAPIDLTNVAALQSIPPGTSVTFRLYAWGNHLTTSTNTVAMGRVDGPKLSGSVVQEGLTPLTIVSSLPGPEPVPGLHIHSEGTGINATAPEEISGGEGVRHHLGGWSGTGSAPSEGTDNSVTFNLDDPTTLEWNWNLEHRLEVTATGDGVVRVSRTEPSLLLGFDVAMYHYDDDGDYPPPQISNENGIPASQMASGIGPSTLTRGPGITPRALGLGGISSENWNGVFNLGDAIAGDKYLEFNLTPTGGDPLNISSIYVPYRYSATANHSIALLYSFDNFATYDVAESLRIQDQNSGTNLDNHLFVLANEPALQGVTSEVTFRVYGWGGTGTGVGTFAIYDELLGPDLKVYGGSTIQTDVAGSEVFWLGPDSLVAFEPVAASGSMFTGWSGISYSNASRLSGGMEEPILVAANFDASSEDDGIPDWWKEFYFGSEPVDASGDPDGDGFTNLEEYLRGTDPTFAEELVATDEFPVSFWENVQRDPELPGQFIIYDFGDGYRGLRESSNNNRSALDPYRPDGGSVTSKDNLSYDGPRVILREEVWEDEWQDATISTVLSVGDDDGNNVYFRYQDEYNWYRVTVTGEVNDSPNRPEFGVRVDKRVDGEYYSITRNSFMGTDPEDDSWYKRIRIDIEQDGQDFEVTVAGWEQYQEPFDFDYSVSLSFFDSDLEWGRAGLGTWAQGGGFQDVTPEWNPVDVGVLFESFILELDGTIVLDEDWSAYPLHHEVPDSWENPFDSVEGVAGFWRNSAHGTMVQTTLDGEATGSVDGSPRADADGPVLLGPDMDAEFYVLELGIHPFNVGGAGFVFDWEDADNYGRVLFTRVFRSADGLMPSGVVVSRKTDGVWTDLLIGDETFLYRPGQPFHISFSRAGTDYIMTVREIDNPETVHRWAWEDSAAPSEGNRYGFASWQMAQVHFLYADVYGVVATGLDGDLAVTAIEKSGETIVLTVENPSGEPYSVQRTLDLGAEWETVDTNQSGETWTGPIPDGAERAFWRLIR